MENYKKPLIASVNLKDGVFPLAGLALGPILSGAVAAIGAAGAAAAASSALTSAIAGGALAAGVAGGLMASSKKGGIMINSMRTATLTARKNFALE